VAGKYLARPEIVPEILGTAATLLAGRVGGSNHAGIDAGCRCAVEDAINLCEEVMQRLSSLRMSLTYGEPPGTGGPLRTPRRTTAASGNS
jgi:hypothetical protein